MLEFTQKEVELEIAAILEDGDIKDISNISGIGYSYIDQQLNPNDARKSYIFGCLLIACALDKSAPERGEKLFRTIIKFRELSKKRNLTEICVNAETSKLNTEFSQFINAKIEGLPHSVQLSEVVDIISQAEKVKEALIADYNKAKEEPKAASLKIAK